MAPQVTWGHVLCFLSTEACAWTLPSVKRSCQSLQSLFPRYSDTMSRFYLLFEKITFFLRSLFYNQAYIGYSSFAMKNITIKTIYKRMNLFHLQSQVRFQHSSEVSMAESIRSGYWSRNLRVHTLNHNCKSKREEEKKTLNVGEGFYF